MIKKLKTGRESKQIGENLGEKISNFRSKINEIIDYINEKEEIEGLKTFLGEAISEILVSSKKEDATREEKIEEEE